MSKLLKQVTLLVSRTHYHGGDGLEDLGLRFFRSQEDYDKEAEEKGWFKDDKSFRSSWCVKPVEMKAMVDPRHHRAFLDGKPLSAAKVFFAAGDVTKVHRIGAMRM